MNLVDTVKTLRNWAIDKSMSQPVVFHHVPKCGGTSVGRAIRKRYWLSQVSIDAEATYKSADTLYGSSSFEESWARVSRFREEALIYFMHCNVRCISAHVGFSSSAYKEFENKYKFITVLREPVSRFISQFHYSYEHQSGLSLKEFLTTEQARYIGVRYTEYFQGSHVQCAKSSPAAEDAAKKNLGKFDVVGFIEEPNKMADQIKRVLGFNLKIGHENKGVYDRQYTAKPDPETYAAIRELCKSDIEIYEYARTHFG